MKKTLLAILAVTLCASSVAQNQVYEQSNNQSATRSKSANSETSLYRIMLNALQAANPSEYFNLTFNNFSSQNSCVYLRQNGQLIEDADRNVPNYGGSQQSNTEEVIYQVNSFLYKRLVSFLALSEITKESFPTIQSRRMNSIQAENYLAEQFRKKMVSKLDELAPTVDGLPRSIYFEAEGQTLGQGGGMNCFSNVGVNKPWVKVVYGFLTKWRMVQGPYNLTWDGLNFTISKNGFQFIGDGSILGSNLTIGSGSSAESSSGKFQKKNQVGN